MSPDVQFDRDALDRVAAAIYAEIDGPMFVEKLKSLRANFDWNPFDEDEDEFVGPWAEIRENFRLVGDVALAAVHCAERITIAGMELSAPQKHAAVVAALDDIIRLPWYLEPFDGPALDMAVSTAVAALNGMKWFREVSGHIVDAKADKLDLTVKVASIEANKVRSARANMAGIYREVG